MSEVEPPSLRGLAEGLVRLGLGNPVLLNLIFVLVCLGGLLSWRWLPKEEFPPVATDAVGVALWWPGSTPDDIEQAIVLPVEDALAKVTDVESIESRTEAGLTRFTLTFDRGTDLDAARDEVDKAVRDVPGLPDDMLTPWIDVLELVIPIVRVGLVGDVYQESLADVLSDELSAMPGVKRVEMKGVPEALWRVDLDPARLAARGLTVGDVRNALAAAQASVPAGEVESDGLRSLVRTSSRLEEPADLARVPLYVGDGLTLTVGDIGRVLPDRQASSERYRVNGQPAIQLTLIRQEDADTLTVVDQVNDWARERKHTLPPGLDLVVYDDSSVQVRDRLRTVFSNGAAGIVLVALFLAIFIGRRNALLVIWGMPVAYLGAVGAMYVANVSVNVITTFALLLVTGIIVDDAIVIVENVQRHLEMGKDRIQATLHGVTEVFTPVLSATATTCLAFAPMMMLDGTVGRVMAFIPRVVIFSLVASLIEAFFVLPGHLGHYAVSGPENQENAATRALKRFYAPIVGAVTRPWLRYVSLAALALTFLGTLVLGSTMDKTLTTPGKPTFVLVDVDLPDTASLDDTERTLLDLERFVQQDIGDGVTWMRSLAGQQANARAYSKRGPQYGQIKVGFANEPEVLDRVPAFMERVRQYLVARPELDTFSIESVVGGPPVGKAVDLWVTGEDDDRVMAAHDALLAHLQARPGVRDVQTSVGLGPEELRVEVDADRAASFGLRPAQVGMRVREALRGEQALEITVGQELTEVRVGLAGGDTARAEDLRDLTLSLGDGRTVALQRVATVTRTRAPRVLNRVDRRRAVRISSDIEESLTSAEGERESVETALTAHLQGAQDVHLVYAGELADAEESFSQLPTAFAMAIALIYAVLAIQFRSYVQPLIILAAVPLGITGVILGLFGLGMDISFISMLGTVALVGIVVNDSLVLIDFINQERARGTPPREAVVTASLTRLRPILITTVTTVLGLAPLGMGLLGEDPLLAPMAVAISFGLGTATALSLIAIPVLYLVVEDVGRLWRWT